MIQTTKRISRVRLYLALFIFIISITISGCGPSDEQPKVKAVKGQPAPDFSLTDLQGNNWRLSDLHGKVVFINFWATWCPPCLKELPSMQALNERMDPKTFQMLTILYNDRPELGHSMVNKAGYTFPVLIDPDSSVSTQYGLTGVPETFIIGPQGILRYKFIGPYDWNSPGALEVLQQFISK